MGWEYLILSVTSGMLESDAPLEPRGQDATVGSEKLGEAMTTLGTQKWEAFSTASDSKGAVIQMFFKRPK